MKKIWVRAKRKKHQQRKRKSYLSNRVGAPSLNLNLSVSLTDTSIDSSIATTVDTSVETSVDTGTAELEHAAQMVEEAESYKENLVQMNKKTY